MTRELENSVAVEKQISKEKQYVERRKRVGNAAWVSRTIRVNGAKGMVHRSERQRDSVGLFGDSKIVVGWECIRGRGSITDRRGILAEFWRTEVEEFETNAWGRSSWGVSQPGSGDYLVFVTARSCRQNLTHGQLNADFERVFDVETRVPSLGFCTSNDSKTRESYFVSVSTNPSVPWKITQKTESYKPFK